MIGYGLSDTEVISVSRCSASGLLVLALQSMEDEFVKNVPSSTNLSITTFDPTTELYGWFKVMEDVVWNN